MNTQKLTRKLALHRETLRTLDTDTLNEVNGGVHDPAPGSGGAGGAIGQAATRLLNDTVFRTGGSPPKLNDTVYRGGGRIIPV